MVSMESLGIFAKLLETTGNAVIRNIKIRCRCQSFLYFDLNHCFFGRFSPSRSGLEVISILVGNLLHNISFEILCLSTKVARVF